MADPCPTLALFRGGPQSAQISAGLSYLSCLLATGHAVPRRKLLELELAMADWARNAREQERAAAAPSPVEDLALVRARPWWFRFGGGRV